MRENCFVDTSTILKVIIENEVELLEGLSKYVLHTSTNVLEEASFKIIVASVLGELNVERTNFFKIKEEFERGIAEKIIIDRLHVLNFLKSRFVVLPVDDTIFDLSKEIVEKYKLLPNDALIAATCKHYSIKKIATFDDDFKRVNFLEVVEV